MTHRPQNYEPTVDAVHTAGSLHLIRVRGIRYLSALTDEMERPPLQYQVHYDAVQCGPGVYLPLHGC